MPYTDASITEIELILRKASAAFDKYSLLKLSERADFLRAVAKELELRQEALIDISARETHLAKGRLKSELTRTIYQLTSYAAACEEGSWMDIRIDTADPERNPPKPDLRKMMVPLGPVVIFGASNFPFAYSTAGGDTACALAAGCCVIIKAHPAHAETSQTVASAIIKIARLRGLPDGIFSHVYGSSFEVGKALAQHPHTKAIAFTGSVEGGRALYEIGSTRNEPIPVFAEMGSVNPVFMLPGKLKTEFRNIASDYAVSITQSAGQFCTNPGILVGIEGMELNNFLEALGQLIGKINPSAMLHPGIAGNFHKKRKLALEQEGVSIIAETAITAGENESIPTLAKVKAELFLENPVLHKEVFGPYSLVVICRNITEMKTVADKMEGQLTVTLLSTTEEAQSNPQLLQSLQKKCGRFIFNGVPTGVEVALAMHHGGPYPATTDSRFTAVGADGIKRFARPVCYQSWEDELLPNELKNANPLQLWRTVNNQITNKAIA